MKRSFNKIYQTKLNSYLDIYMAFGSHYLTSHGQCCSTQEYNDNTNNYYLNIFDDDYEKYFLFGFFLPYCDECNKYMEFTNNVCSQHLSHRFLVTFIFYQNDFETFITKSSKVLFVVGQLNVNQKNTPSKN